MRYELEQGERPVKKTVAVLLATIFAALAFGCKPVDVREEKVPEVRSLRVKSVTYEADDSVFGWSEWEYDARGNVTKETYLYYWLTGWMEYEYIEFVRCG